LQNTPPGTLQLEGLCVQPLTDLGSESAKFDLSLSITETANGMLARAEYAADLFDAATIERMMGHWRALLEGIVAEPGQRIARLPLPMPE
jgi:non-ribosomal peptide synthetase component F